MVEGRSGELATVECCLVGDPESVADGDVTVMKVRLKIPFPNWQCEGLSCANTRGAFS